MQHCQKISLEQTFGHEKVHSSAGEQRKLSGRSPQRHMLDEMECGLHTQQKWKYKINKRRLGSNINIVDVRFMQQ